MNQSNYPTGFLGFQARIDTLAESLGGTDAVRLVVEQCFEKRLRDVVRTRLYGEGWGTSQRYSTLWMASTDEDFRSAADAAEPHFRKTSGEPVKTWESGLLKAQIVLRERYLYLEHDKNALILALAFVDESAARRIHPAQTTRRDPWHVALTDDGETVSNVLNRRPSHAATSAQGLTGAQKTLIRFAETIFV